MRLEKYISLCSKHEVNKHGYGWWQTCILRQAVCSQTTEVSRRRYSQSAAVAPSQNLWLHCVLPQQFLHFQLKLGRRARQQNGRVVISWFDILSVECSLSFVNMDCPASESEQWCCAFTRTTTGYDSIPVFHGLTYTAIFWTAIKGNCFCICWDSIRVYTC